MPKTSAPAGIRTLRRSNAAFGAMVSRTSGRFTRRPKLRFKKHSSRWTEADRHTGSAEREPAEIGRASCRDRVCQYVSISVVAVSLKTKQDKHMSETISK